MKRYAFAVLATLAVLAVVQPAWGYEEPEVAFALADERIGESSGLARSPRNQGVLWTHNDSGGEPLVFALNYDGTTRATVRLDPAIAFDWEDMASASSPADGQPALFLGDIGDNFENGPSRDDLTIYVIPEPDLSPVPVGGELVLAPIAYTLVWPDVFHDTETLIVHPDGTEIFLVTKDYHGQSLIFTAKLPPEPAGPITLELVTTLSFTAYDPPNPSFAGPAGPAGFWASTAGDVNDEASLVAVRTYEDFLEWEVPGGDIGAAFASGQPARIDLPDASQGEAFAYDHGGSVYVTSEGVGSDAHVLRNLDTAQPDPDPTAAGPDSFAPTLSSGNQPAAPLPTSGSTPAIVGALFIAGSVGHRSILRARASRRRRG